MKNEQAVLELAKVLKEKLELFLAETTPDEWSEAPSSNWPIMVPKVFVENAFKVISCISTDPKIMEQIFGYFLSSILYSGVRQTIMEVCDEKLKSLSIDPKA